jgi:hypothetical protein
MEERFMEGRPTSIVIPSPVTQWEASPVGSIDPAVHGFVVWAPEPKLSNPYLDNPGAIQ